MGGFGGERRRTPARIPKLERADKQATLRACESGTKSALATLVRGFSFPDIDSNSERALTGAAPAAPRQMIVSKSAAGWC